MFPTIPWSDCKNRNKDEQEGGSGLPANRWDVSTPCVWVDNKFTLPSKVCIHLYIYTPWRAAGSHSRVKTWLRTDHCIFSRESSPWAIVAREWATFFAGRRTPMSVLACPLSALSGRLLWLCCLEFSSVMMRSQTHIG